MPCPEGDPRFDPRATPRGISGSVGGYGEGAEGGVGIRVGDFRSDRSEPMLQLSDRQDRGPLGGSGNGERVACYIVCHGCSASRFGNCGLHWSGSLYTCRALACGPAFGRATMPLGRCRCVNLPSGPSANRSGSDVRESLAPCRATDRSFIPRTTGSDAVRLEVAEKALRKALGLKSGST